MSARQAMTMVASQALNFAELFDTAFRGGLQGPVPYRIELTKPSGPSTAGGRQILQHIRLLPVAGGPATVMGSVNGVSAQVELRSFNYIAEAHRRRYKGAQIPVDAGAYTRLIKAMEAFFMVQRFATIITDQVPEQDEDELDEEPQSGGIALTAMVICGVIIMVTVIVGLFVMTRK